MYNEKKIRKSELLQLILLDSLYAQSGTDRITFQGGTALRWDYNGMRFNARYVFPATRFITHCT